MTEDLYEILGVDRTATAEDIKLAFRLRSKTHHPDAGGEDEEFKRLQNAYEILSEPDKRVRYDEHGIVGDVAGQAVQALQGVFDMMIESDKIVTADIVAVAHRIIKTKLMDATAAKKDGEAELRKFLRLANRVRLKPTAQGGNIFLQVLTVKEVKLRKVMVEVRTAIAVWKAAKKLLDEHENHFDEHLALMGVGSAKGFAGTGFTFGDEP